MVMATLRGILSRMVRGVVFQHGIECHLLLRLGQLHLVFVHIVRSVLRF